MEPVSDLSDEITGVSAVNADGQVLIFCEASFPRFEYFLIEGNAVVLVCDEPAAMLTRTYGVTTIETVKACGFFHVQPIDLEGKPLAAYRIEVAHG